MPKLGEKRGHYKNFGKPLDEEHKKHISESLKGNQNKLGTHHSEETKEKLRQSKIGFKHTEESKAKIKAARASQVCSPETRAKMSAARTGSKNPFYGRKLTDEQKQHLREINAGENHPNYGKHLSEETKNKIRESHIKDKNYNYGIPHTEEHKKKISLSISKDKNPNWQGGISFYPYCPKFDEPMKENVRAFFGGRCVICGKTKEENSNSRYKTEKLSVHHVFTEKMAGCETKIQDMEAVRKRLPKEIARIGAPEFSSLEIAYIRMMVPLCRSDHSSVGGEDSDIEFEKSEYRKFFVDVIMNKYNGKCYTEEST